MASRMFKQWPGSIHFPSTNQRATSRSGGQPGWCAKTTFTWTQPDAICKRSTCSTVRHGHPPATACSVQHPLGNCGNQPAMIAMDAGAGWFSFEPYPLGCVLVFRLGLPWLPSTPPPHPKNEERTEHQSKNHNAGNRKKWS